jgi:parallel beta-helix repeat protein
VDNNTCNSNDISGIYLYNSDWNTVVKNTCTYNTEGIFLGDSQSNTVAYNTCNDNAVGIELYESNFNTVAYNTGLGNTEHDIYLNDSPQNMVFHNFSYDPDYISVVILLIGLVGITLLGADWWTDSARVGQDEIIVPTRYRLVSWFRKKRSLKLVDVDESLEQDSSDQ